MASYYNLTLARLIPLFAGMLLFTALLIQEALAAEDEVQVFFDTCLASNEAFADVEVLSAKLGFEKSKEKFWMRKNDSLSIMLVDAPDRNVCVIARIGDHTSRFTSEINLALTTKFDGKWEAKSHQGRKLFLVQNRTQKLIVEVLPPSGATTMITASIRKN